eukprot:CAMPEP_0116014172 /NCGR_PEP_ID=MMETSP0321-20121206/6132_1 /TAXON_ID=163516 /ORGANISM="Leptocylindrus danicus var. danicus, Strain B650" /LENGTH=904 /DNA_ID=CAMNT_0003483799 /DNA_START=123 /DNA_END=2836 /DNA_ORIENTATION=+
MRVMAVFEESDKIAFACYDESKNEIILDQSRAHGHDTEAVVSQFTSDARPNLVLVSSKIASSAGLLSILTRDRTAVTARRDVGDPQNGPTGQQQTAVIASVELDKPTIPYRLLKSGSFDVRACRSVILNKLRILSLLHRQPRQQQQQQQQQQQPGLQRQTVAAQESSSSSLPFRTPSSYHSLAAFIDFDSSVLIRALGALLSFLQGTVFRLEENDTVTVNTIRTAAPSNFMSIDPTTFNALHIFSTEHHPLIAKGYGNSKEGFSLFTLLDRCKSKVGRQCLREWMLKPLLDAKQISNRQDGVELFLAPDCSAAVRSILSLLQKVGAVDKILLRMQKCVAAPNDFLIFSRTLDAAISICSLLSGDFKSYVSALRQKEVEEGIAPEDSAAIRANSFLDGILNRCHTAVLRDLHGRIVAIVDEELTLEQKSVVVHYGYNEELDSAKEAFERLDETLSMVGSQVLNKYPDLRQLKVVFLPQVKLIGVSVHLNGKPVCLPVRKTIISLTTGWVLDIFGKRHHQHNPVTNEYLHLPPDFTFIFTQDSDAFFKNPDMRQLDQDIGDLDAFIKDTESFVISELEDDILDCEHELRDTFAALAELDCIIAFANCASDLNYVRPEVVSFEKSGGVVFIENGRHPLQELIIEDAFIPNDTMIDSSNRVNIITGPNFSGKSCYTRQVGMLVYMAHLGCFLPCDRAKIAITDQILARISSVETCAVPQSSFQLDLTQMATILRRSTQRTLVLVDEFGKGTAPASGIAVLTAALRKLVSLKSRVVCTTHFLEVFSLGLLKDNVDGVRVLRMAVHVPESNEDNPVPLFKLELGIAKTSAGLVCAKMAGVPTNVISRAKEILSAVKGNNPVQPVSDSANANLATSQETARDTLRVFLGVDSWANATDDELNTLYQRISLM